MIPIHIAEAPPFRLEVFYEGEHHRFKLAVYQHSECRMIQYIPATYEPLFGIDAADMRAINDEAEAICLELESGQ